MLAQGRWTVYGAPGGECRAALPGCVPRVTFERPWARFIAKFGQVVFPSEREAAECGWREYTQPHPWAPGQVSLSGSGGVPQLLGNTFKK